MIEILKTIEPVVARSRHVHLDRGSVAEVCDRFIPADVQYWMDAAPFDFSGMSDEEKCNFILVFSSVNFCYWGDPKWTVEHRGRKFDGAWGMVASLVRTIEAGMPMLDAGFLANMTDKELRDVLRGNIDIPLFWERLRILRRVGRTLKQKYGGRMTGVVKAAGGDALRLLEIVVTDFPSLNDVSAYEGRQVFFHKRAQLAVCDIFRTFGGKGPGALDNIDRMTAFADYKIPQVLRRLGILHYTPELADTVDNGILIPQGSPEEVEIRANTVWAVELLREGLKDRIPGITSMDIDSHLWLEGQKKSPEDKPYHLTRTVSY